MPQKRCYVGSEVGQLRRVMLHHPHLSLERLTPSNCEDLLFDDVLRVEKAEKEHDALVRILQSHGVEVLLLEDLLTETLENEAARDWLLARQCSSYYLGTALADELKSFLIDKSPSSMAHYLLGGVSCEDIGIPANSLTQKMKHPHDFVIPPLPNHLFTRDTSCWIGNGVSVNPMAKKARKRETENLRAIYRFHPLFADANFNYWYGNNDRNYYNATLEGGDVLILGKGIVLVGLGERSTPQAVELLATALFEKNAAKEVIAIQLPEQRSTMHLDTVMTMVDRDCFTIFPPVIDSIRSWSLTPAPSGHKKIRVNDIENDFFGYLAKVLDTGPLRLVPTGGNFFQMEREQWNDANNVLAIKPGMVVGYQRNTYTIANLRDAGIKVLDVEGEELGRGRGGPRCMSCPIERDD